jgi:hypothetical protein
MSSEIRTLKLTCVLTMLSFHLLRLGKILALATRGSMVYQGWHILRDECTADYCGALNSGFESLNSKWHRGGCLAIGKFRNSYPTLFQGG